MANFIDQEEEARLAGKFKQPQEEPKEEKPDEDLEFNAAGLNYGKRRSRTVGLSLSTIKSFQSLMDLPEGEQKIKEVTEEKNPLEKMTIKDQEEKSLDIRLLVGSINFEEYLTEDHSEIIAAQTNLPKLQDIIQKSSQKIWSYYLAFKYKSVTLLKILLKFSKELSQFLEQFSTNFIHLKLGLLNVLQLVNNTKLKDPQRKRTQTALNSLANLAKGMAQIDLKNFKNLEKNENSENPKHKGKMEEKPQAASKLRKGSFKYPELHSDPGQFKMANKELHGLIEMVMGQCNELLNAVDCATQEYKEIHGNLVSGSFLPILKSVDELAKEYSRKLSATLRKMEIKVIEENYNPDNHNTLALLEYKLCFMMRLFWINLNDNYYAHLFRIHSELKRVPCQADKEGRSFWELIEQVNSLSSDIYLGAEEFLVPQGLLDALAPHKQCIAQSKEGLSVDLNLMHFVHQSYHKFIHTASFKLPRVPTPPKDLHSFMTSQNLKNFFYNYSSKYTSKSSFIVAYVKQVYKIRDAPIIENSERVLALDVSAPFNFSSSAI
jgi:hypothetical protein